MTSGASTAPDRYAIVVTGTAEVTRTRAVTVALDVDTVAPVGTVSLISPTDAITNVALRPTFAWVASPSARTYRVQVSGNAAFWPLVLDAPAEDTSYQPDVPLLKDSTYHWRVVAQNGCGSITSTTRVFTTVNPVDVFYDTVENGADRWLAETPLGAAQWSLTDRFYHSASHAWHMASAPTTTDARLTLAQPITVRDAAILSFWHWYDMESAGTTAWDGGVIEISDDGGSTWDDLGNKITANGYEHTVSESYGNPLKGLAAWSGSSGGWREVKVDLSAYAGSSVTLRFRWGGDSSNLGPYDGWYVDDIRVTEIWPPSRYKTYLPWMSRTR